jgi:hypothetical protein
VLDDTPIINPLFLWSLVKPLPCGLSYEYTTRFLTLRVATHRGIVKYYNAKCSYIHAQSCQVSKIWHRYVHKMQLQPAKYFANFVTVQEQFIAYCRCRETVKLRRFLLSPYSLTGTCYSVQNCTFRDCTGTFYTLL